MFNIKKTYQIFLLLLLLNNQNNILSYNNHRETSAPYISGDSFRAIAHYIYDETNQSLKGEHIKPKSIIFVKTDYLKKFFTTIHPTIPHKYILITHNSDYGSPAEFVKYLEDEKLYKWFGQNPTIMHHEKFTAIPIGIANKMWGHGNTAIFNHALHANVKQSQYLLGINFSVGTRPNVRQYVYNLFHSKQFCKNIGSPDLFTYLVNMKKTQFILSPRGNGLDCHRTWEALLMGTIPILQHSNMDEILSDLPVLIVNQWSDITEDFLKEQYDYIKNNFTKYNHSKIRFEYWQKLIENTLKIME